MVEYEARLYWPQVESTDSRTLLGTVRGMNRDGWLLVSILPTAGPSILQFQREKIEQT